MNKKFKWICNCYKKLLEQYEKLELQNEIEILMQLKKYAAFSIESLYENLF